MTTASPRPTQEQTYRDLPKLHVSAYDQVSGMLIAVLLFLGVVTLLMFGIWLSSRFFRIRPAVPVRVLEDVGGGGSGNSMAGGERELEEPAPEELQEVETPLTEQLDAISNVVTAEAALLDSLEGDSSFGRGEGSGSGDGRGIGPGGPGTSDGIPAWERWEVRMQATTLALYAQQLDYFKVELGVAGGGDPNVHYISNLSNAKPTVRVGTPKEETRLRFTHRSGQLREADRALAAKAGVNTDGRVVFQFYTPETYQALLTLENEHMGKRRIVEVLRTVFGVRGTAGRWEFYVISQEYRGGA